MSDTTPASNGIGRTDAPLTPAQAESVCAAALPEELVRGKRVLTVIPDLTRTCPMGQLFRLLHERLTRRATRIDFMVALGTHPPLSREQIYERVEIDADEHQGRFADVRFFNHEWDAPEHLVEIGRIHRDDIAVLTDGRFQMDVPVTLNRRVLDYDMVLTVGPVFPHEVAGFSGGNKYLVPGIAGQEIIDFFHWLGAVITNTEIIGRKWTPVRRVIDAAAAFVTAQRRALCMVVDKGELAGLYHGTPEQAWSAAADLSARLHVVYKDRAYHTVLSCAPPMYDELWVGGKCMYKIEPVVADGGTIIVYAPHIQKISATHGERIAEIGYHTRDYFLAQWDRFRHHPWGVLAHSTHVKGGGSYEDGIETPRVEVVLATGIPEATCRAINLGYMDPASIDPADYEGREDEGVLCVPRAGETLFRLHDRT